MGTIQDTPCTIHPINKPINSKRKLTLSTVPSMKEKYSCSPFLKNIPSINR